MRYRATTSLGLPAMLVVSVGIAFSSAGCASTSSNEPVAPSLNRCALPSWSAENSAGADEFSRERNAVGSRSVAPVMTGTTRIVPPAQAEARPPRTARIDVQFQHAELTHVLQFLADAGRFNVVIEGGLKGEVSATLKGVDAWDALVMLAKANGAQARYEKKIAYVGKNVLNDSSK